MKKTAIDDSIYEGHAARIWGNARIFADERKTGKVMRPDFHIKRIAEELRASSEALAVVLLRDLVLDRDKLRDSLTIMKEKVRDLDRDLKNEKQKLDAAKKKTTAKKESSTKKAVSQKQATEESATEETGLVPAEEDELNIEEPLSSEKLVDSFYND